MRSGDEERPFTLTRGEIEAIVDVFEAYAAERSYIGYAELKKFYDPVHIKAYDRMSASLEMMYYLEDPDGN